MNNKKLPDGIEFDGHVYWCRCPECGNEQGDMGNSIRCEQCGYGPMPTMDGVDNDIEETPEQKKPVERHPKKKKLSKRRS